MARLVVAVALMLGVPTLAQAKPADDVAMKPHPSGLTERKWKRPPLVQPVRKAALKLLGIPYVWGGSTTSGFDCSGLTRYILAQVGVPDVPHYTGDQIGMGEEVPNVAKSRPGDLLFPNYGHVMMNVGQGQAIAAPQTGDVVKLVPITSRSYIAIRRIKGAWVPWPRLLAKYQPPKPRKYPVRLMQRSVRKHLMAMER